MPLFNRQKIDLNPLFVKALRLLEETQKNVFITGRAGTGKSTLLSYFRTHTKKTIVVLAPTGVAALNVNGQTIHSFFGFKPNITVAKVKKLKPDDKKLKLLVKLDAIVIDEVSMVRADLLDCIDKFLRLNLEDNTPFGGIQIVFIGDLYQLPPVVTYEEKQIFTLHYQSPYFFDAHVFPDLTMEFIELEKIYRQKDQDFIDLLNAVRNNSITGEQIEVLNSRLQPDFEAPTNGFFMHLTTTNAMAADINQVQLKRLKGKEYTYEGEIGGKFDPKFLPTTQNLNVKIDAQVMMLNNDSFGQWVNGSVGKIVKIAEDKEEGDSIIVKLSDGKTVSVEPFTWNLFSFEYNEEKRQVISKTIGTFTQYPLMLAWAVTIHKAQGKTFEQVILDIGNGSFAHGQTYVALSRCVSLQGLILKRPLKKQHIFMDWRVVKFVTSFQYSKSDQQLNLVQKETLLAKAKELESSLEIVYLKANDEKSTRRITPLFIGNHEYLGKSFYGVTALDSKSGDQRVFKLERILEIRE